MQDSQSTQIKPGDYIAYAASRGGNEHSAMIFGRVLEVGDFRIRAIVSAREWLLEGQNWREPRVQWLTNGSKLIVVSRDSLNPHLWAMLHRAAEARGYEFES